jgi:hypothetical protein
MRKLGVIWEDLRRGVSAFSRKAVLLTAALASILVLWGLERGNREATTVSLGEVVVKLSTQQTVIAKKISRNKPSSAGDVNHNTSPRIRNEKTDTSSVPTIQEILATVPRSYLEEKVATEDNAWSLLQRPFRKYFDDGEERLNQERDGLYDSVFQLSKSLSATTAGSSDLRALHEELARIDGDIRSVRATHEAQISTLDAQEKVRLATREAEGIAQPATTQNPKLPDPEAALNAHERAQVLVDQRRNLDMLLFRQQKVLTEIEPASFHASNADQELQRQLAGYQRGLEVNAARLAALITKRDRYLDDAREDVKHAFAAVKRDERKIVGFSSTPEEFPGTLFDRQSAVHAIYDLIWYAALAIAVVSLSAFIFVAVIQLLSLPSKLTEAFDKRVSDLLEKAPELLKQSVTADALKTSAASLIALIVSYRAVSGTADHAKSSPVNEKAAVEASVLTPGDFAWSAGRDFPRDNAPSRDGRDGQAGREGSAGRDGNAGRDANPGRDGIAGGDGVPGRDGPPGRDGRDGEPGPQGPGGAPPVDVWTASIQGLNARTEGAETRLADLRTRLGEESKKREVAELKSAQLSNQVGTLDESLKRLSSDAEDLKNGRKEILTQGALWDMRSWREDLHLTSLYQVGPLSLAILKARLGIEDTLRKDSLKRSKLTREQAVRYALYDRLESLSQTNKTMKARAFEEEIAAITGREDGQLETLIMDICRLPR